MPGIPFSEKGKRAFVRQVRSGNDVCHETPPRPVERSCAFDSPVVFRFWTQSPGVHALFEWGGWFPRVCVPLATERMSTLGV
eukprot:scaffold100_cov323-Pavlova_lutheri.AAC.37